MNRSDHPDDSADVSDYPPLGSGLQMAEPLTRVRITFSPRGVVWRHDDTVSMPSSLRPTLWVLAVCLFGIGDVVSTSVGLQSGSIVEVGPIVGPFVRRHGLLAMTGLKTGLFAICIVIWKSSPRPMNFGVPLGLTILGFLTTGWNAIVILYAG